VRGRQVTHWTGTERLRLTRVAEAYTGLRGLCWAVVRAEQLGGRVRVRWIRSAHRRIVWTVETPAA
jgi:hypothetical protein